MPPGNLPRRGWLDALHVDKAVHAVLFAVFFVLLVGGFQGFEARNAWRIGPRWSAFLVVVVYAFFTEWAQDVFTTGRQADLSDVLADVAGVALGMAYLRWGAAWVEQFRKR